MGNRSGIALGTILRSWWNDTRYYLSGYDWFSVQATALSIVAAVLIPVVAWAFMGAPGWICLFFGAGLLVYLYLEP